MSSNNRLIVIEKSKNNYEVHYDACVDNEFEPNKETLLKTFKDLKKAIQWGNKYCIENMIEYGCRIDV